MKNPRHVAIAVVGAGVAGLIGVLMIYAAILTSSWLTLLLCMPAILVMIGIVASLASGVLFFGTEESETPEERSHPDGFALFERASARLERLVHRPAH